MQQRSLGQQDLVVSTLGLGLGTMGSCGDRYPAAMLPTWT